jgi:hypothetical protein
MSPGSVAFTLLGKSGIAPLTFGAGSEFARLISPWHCTCGVSRHDDTEGTISPCQLSHPYPKLWRWDGGRGGGGEAGELSSLFLYLSLAKHHTTYP